MNRTVIYARTSSPSETALDRQVQILQGLAAALSLNVTYIIYEVASGLDFERTGLNELIRLAKRHEIDAVLVTNLENIGRSAADVLSVLEELDKHDVKLFIQGGDTVEASNPLRALLHRFAPHPSLEVILASATE